jgi:transposase-like protein
MPIQPKVSKDIRAHILALHHEFSYNVKKICQLLDIKKSLAYKILQLHRFYGIIVEPRTGQWGCWRKLTMVNQSFILALLNQQHTIYLDEIQEELLLLCGVKVSIPFATFTSHIRMCLARPSNAMTDITRFT